MPNVKSLKRCELLTQYNYDHFLSSGLCLTWSVNNKSRTLKTEYRRILKLEKTSEGINVKLIFSKTNVNTKNLKKHTTLCMRALVKRIRAQGGCLGTKSR